MAICSGNGLLEEGGDVTPCRHLHEPGRSSWNGSPSSSACPICGRPSSLRRGGKGQEGGGGETTMTRILEKFL